jgi:ribosomal protein L24E
MNYKSATISKTFKYSSQAKNDLAYKLSTVPKGWIYIQKNGKIYHTLSKKEQEMFDNYLMQKKLLHTNEKFFNRYVQRKVFQMERDGYNEEEINNYIETAYSIEDDDDYEETDDIMEYDYYSDESYDSY